MSERARQENEDELVRNLGGRRTAFSELSSFVDSMPGATLVLDDQGIVRLANVVAERLLGPKSGSIANARIEHLIPGAPFVVEFDGERRLDTSRRFFGSLHAQRRDERDLYLEVALAPIQTDDGPMTVVGLCDATRQVLAEREIVRLAADLRSRLEELGDAIRAKDLLLREIHHRVKNNLQIVSSLLSLQSRRVHDDEARRLFEDSRDRLVSMSLVHEQLYRGSDLGRVDFAGYLRSLVAGITRGHVDDSDDVAIAVFAEPISMPIDVAVPAGLIVHELVSNALKHAFPDGRTGSITVRLLSLPDGRREISVCDDGVGEIDDVDAQTSFGKRLITLLVRQLGAETEVVSDRGTTVSLRFRESQEEERVP